MKIADMHCDTISQIWERQKAGNRQQLFQNSLHVDIQKMQKAAIVPPHSRHFSSVGSVSIGSIREHSG